MLTFSGLSQGSFIGNNVPETLNKHSQASVDPWAYCHYQEENQINTRRVM